MKTGEGKTLVSTLPVYLNALAGNGRPRGHRQRLPGHPRLGVDGPAPPLPRAHRGPGRPGHRRLRRPSARPTPADVTYGTNTEFGFDYLRDNMARSKDAMVQRGHRFAIVDEVDSILIDEARTPLIISGPGGRVGPALLPVRRHRADAPGRGRLRGRRGEAHRRPHRGGHREGRAPARRGQPLRRGGGQLRPPPHPGPAGQGALPAGQGLPGGPGRGEDRRRVHRAHPRRAALVRRAPPGGRGQGAGAGSKRRTTPGPPSPSRTTSASTRSCPG